VGKTEDNFLAKKLGRARHRLENYIKWNLFKKCGKNACGLDSSGSGWEPLAGCCEHGIDLAGFLNIRGIS
jgi:hypothetical protein